MSLNVQPDCNEMQKYVDSYELRISLILNLLIALIAIPVLIRSFIFVSSKHIFHHNTRLQVQVHILSLLIHSIGRFFLHSLDLYNYMKSWNSACEIIPNFYRCLIFRGFYNIGLALSSMCSIALVIERFIATLYSGSYEHCKIYWGAILAIFQCFLASFYLGSLYFHAAFKPENIVLYYCQTIASSSGSILFVIVPLYSVMFLQIFSKFAFHFILEKNRKLRSLQSISLSNRFNLDQGIRSIGALRTLVDCNTIVFIILSIVTTTLHFNSDLLSKQVYLALVEVVHILPFYGIAVSIMVYSKLKKQNKKKQFQLSNAIKTNPEYYFEQFKRQLNQ